MPQYELTYLNDVLPTLKDYVIQDKLFWPVNMATKASYPKLTLGNVLLFLKRLDAKDAAAAEQLRGQVNEVKKAWRTHWEKKEQQEIVSRIRQWSEYLEELTAEFSAHSPYYDNAVRTRVLLTLLIEDLGEDNLPPEITALDVLDATLWPRILEGAFMWDAALADAFSPDDFWFLYGYLRA